MFRSVPKGHVRRPCPSCSEKIIVSHEQLGTKVRCPACGALLYPKEVDLDVLTPRPSYQSAEAKSRVSSFFSDKTIPRKCPDCDRKNQVEAAHLGQLVRCSSCGALLFRDEFKEYAASPRGTEPTQLAGEPARSDSPHSEVRYERVVERQVLVTRCKFCSCVTPVDLATCQGCGAPKFMN